MSFNIRMTYFPVTGSLKKGQLSIDKPKTTRLRWNTKKTAWQMLGRKRTIEPFDPEFIYAGRNVYAFKIGDDFVPVRVGVDSDNVPNFKPIPYSVQNWHMMEVKKNEMEFQNKDWWSENKYFFMVVITAAVCMAVVAITVYYTYKYAGGGFDKMQSLTEAINNINVIPRRS